MLRWSRRAQQRYTLGSVNSVIQRASSLVSTPRSEKARDAHPRQRRNCSTGVAGRDPFLPAGAMCELEGGAGSPSSLGAAAVANTILAFVERGDHILVTNTAYEPTRISVRKFSPNSASPPAGSTRSSAAISLVWCSEHPRGVPRIPPLHHHEVHDVPAIVAAVRRSLPKPSL